MVQINNQAVIQKLIDELKLYPGTGMIPTELADKILPVFQINSEELTISTTPANVVRTAQATGGTGGTDATIYTVPATGKFYLTNVALHCDINDANARSGAESITITIDGSTQVILGGFLQIAANGLSGFANALNLQNPILLDQGTNIVVHAGNTGQRATGSIVGYTSA